MTDPIRLFATFSTAAPAPPLDVLWDPERGTFSGAGADLLTTATEGKADGVTYQHTGLTSTADPRHDAAALAIVIATLGYLVPAPLNPALRELLRTSPPDDQIPGAVT